MKILIVDDDSRRAGILSDHIFQGVGIDSGDIFIVGNCSDASNCLRQSYFDVLIIDVNLPRREGDAAAAKNGIDLLRALDRSRGLRKPGRILGITAKVADLGRYRDEFSKSCVSVIEALNGDNSWRTTICKSIEYQRATTLSRAFSSGLIEVVTIHGIQTFGAWQSRLERIANNTAGDVRFHTYRYGLFSAIAFLVPQLRARESKKLSAELRRIFGLSPDKRFVIFSHSFGTYLLYSALKGLLPEFNNVLPIKRIVLAGSVLMHRTDWSPFMASELEIVNDCADHDYVLYFSQFLVWGVGMAGRCGFYGVSGKLFVNRFHQGGHSSYFKGDSFLAKFWVPLISDVERSTSNLDHRELKFFKHSVLDKVALFIGPFVTLCFYAALFIAAIFVVYLLL